MSHWVSPLHVDHGRDMATPETAALRPAESPDVVRSPYWPEVNWKLSKNACTAAGFVSSAVVRLIN